MREAKLLLVAGRGSGTKVLVTALEREGLQVATYHSGNEAITWAAEEKPAVVVFDASSMRSSGIRICKRIRKAHPVTPMIYCRHAGQIEDRTIGADVYLTQPFTSRKIINRIRALLPADDLEEEIVRAGHLTYFPSKRSVDVGGSGEKRLTPKLACLLEQFLLHPNEILDRKQLMRTVWKTSYFGDTRTLDVHIRWLREVIEENPARPQVVKTVRGMGYIFSIPSKRP
ncbi:MAG: response regulator transcription factor [Candidatus Promineifilaceae bacterium]|jgi:DNA-binding response OmpR family regulator